MSIASGFTKMKNYILTSSGYKLLSRWTSSQTVHMGDGTDDTDTVEYRFGAMKGITSSLATDNDEFALSASAGKNLQNQCTQLNQSLTQLNNILTLEYDAVDTLRKIATYVFNSNISDSGKIFSGIVFCGACYKYDGYCSKTGSKYSGAVNLECYNPEGAPTKVTYSIYNGSLLG